MRSNVEPISLTRNEQKVLYGLICYPHLKDNALSKQIDVKLSTLTSIKRRLQDQGITRHLIVPMLNRLGSELLAVIYTQFNPVIPLQERAKKTKQTIEVFEEIFFSIGEQEKGFSISLSKNYTNIGRINEIRTETFGTLGLLEMEYPHEVIFPFESSDIVRFFDFRRAIGTLYHFEDIAHESRDESSFELKKAKKLSDKEKKVFVEIIRKPNATTQEIGEKVSLSRHTVSRMKKHFFDLQLMKHMVIPDLKQLGFRILAFYHLQFSPGKAPTKEDISYLDSASTFFLARRKYEVVLIAAYPSYQDYKDDKMNKIRYLKENKFISYNPLVRKYMFEQLRILKSFDFSPISNKIIEINSK